MQLLEWEKQIVQDQNSWLKKYNFDDMERLESCKPLTLAVFAPSRLEVVLKVLGCNFMMPVGLTQCACIGPRSLAVVLMVH